MSDNTDFLAVGRDVLNLESEALITQRDLLSESFAVACELILACQGRVIVSGMGKSGHIAQKIAASMTSTGTAAHFLHPAEGVHGDLGVVHRKDLLLVISQSGETQEILDLLSPVKHIGVSVVCITGNPNSTLAQESDAVLLLAQAPEADPHNLVPTTSTTLTLAIGDALVVALMHARDFTPEDFAVFHPRGMLGKRLTLHVRDLLRGDETNPMISTEATFGEALEAITKYKLGGTSLVDADGKLAGIITDGDVRRIFRRLAVMGTTIADATRLMARELMTAGPAFVQSSELAYNALKMMENHQPRPIFLLPVVDTLNRPVGLLHLHDLVQAGFKTTVKG